MSGKPTITNPLFAPSVHGLEHGRKHAHRRAARRRVTNTIVSGAMFIVAAGVVGGAGYYLWQFYVDEQGRNADQGPVVDQRTTGEIIQDLEDNPRWNGPGNPTFGVGDDQP
jgi:hypothetical protein